MYTISENQNKESDLQAFPSGVIVARLVAKTTRLLSVFLRVATTNNTGQNFFFLHQFLHSFFSIMETRRQREMCQGASMTGSPVSLHFPVDFVTGGRQNCMGKAKFMGSQSKHYWHHYAIAITLLHNDTLQQKTCQQSVYLHNILKSLSINTKISTFTLYMFTL